MILVFRLNDATTSVALLARYITNMVNVVVEGPTLKGIFGLECCVSSIIEMEWEALEEE